MKKVFFAIGAFLIMAGMLSASPFKSPSLNGSTGLISTPTANTGWEDSQFGVDVGARYLEDDNDDDTYVGTATLQIFRKFEFAAAYDMQDKRGDDFILNGKFNFYGSGSSALAVGGNYQMIKFNDDDDNHGFYQLYLAATYGGQFFGMPAETTIVFGKTFARESEFKSRFKKSFDFSMGFDLDLLPNLFKGYVHFINDFANYSYSVDPIGPNAEERGCFNTGARICVLKDSRQYKLNIDALLVDVLDKNRTFSLGAAFGMAF
ncbi:MAG: hypothetical protein KA015_00865 [Spirochaetes bacterium]|nr:hypothetical protein [Spirochaetota bacterium]MBP9023436.1 hypothetical protein [Spirochaetota bacterium]